MKDQTPGSKYQRNSKFQTPGVLTPVLRLEPACMIPALRTERWSVTGLDGPECGKPATDRRSILASIQSAREIYGRARLFRRRLGSAQAALINTPLQRGVSRRTTHETASTVSTERKTVGTVSPCIGVPITPLKQGVNESRSTNTDIECEIYGLKDLGFLDPKSEARNPTPNSRTTGRARRATRQRFWQRAQALSDIWISTCFRISRIRISEFEPDARSLNRGGFVP